MFTAKYIITINLVILNYLQKGNAQDLNNQMPESCTAHSTSDMEASCSLPLDDFPAGRFIGGTAARPESFYPKWINLTLARQGQKFAQDFRAYIANSHLNGLVTILAFPDAIDVLMFTHRVDTPQGAAKRYLATAAQTFLWYDNFLKDDQDDNVVLTSLKNVRIRHITAAQRATAELAANKTLIDQRLYGKVNLDKAMWDSFIKDLEASNIPQSSRSWPTAYKSIHGTPTPVNQFQMAMTQFSFVGFPVLFPERIHINTTDENLVAFNHLWAVLGYALGIEDQYNIGLQPNLQKVREYYQRIFDEYFLPAMFGLKQNYFGRLLIQDELEGFQRNFPAITPHTVLLRFLKNIVKIEVPNMMAHLTRKEQALAIAFDEEFTPTLKHPEPRTVINQKMNSSLAANLKRDFGKNYTSQQSIAEYVFNP